MIRTASPRLVACFLGLSMALTLPACGGRRARGSTTVVYTAIDDGGRPVPTARIYVNGVLVGTGSAEIPLPRRGSVPIYVEADGYNRVDGEISRTTRELPLRLVGDPVAAMTIQDENTVCNRWLTIPIDTHAASSFWSTVVSSFVSQDFEIEMLDEGAGFVRTAWKETSAPSASLRRRFVANTVSREPLVWRLRYEVQVRRGGQDWQDYDRGVRDELDVVAEIRARAQAR